jgi:hypothetical protein
MTNRSKGDVLALYTPKACDAVLCPDERLWGITESDNSIQQTGHISSNTNKRDLNQTRFTGQVGVYPLHTSLQRSAEVFRGDIKSLHRHN